MSEVKIRINLDPLHDGVDCASMDPAIDRTDKQAAVIGTNGEYRRVSLKEAGRIMEAMNHCCASFVLGDDYIVIYNGNRTFTAEGTSYYAGSVLVMRTAGSRMFPLSDEELQEVLELLKERMAEFRSGAEYFSALEID